LATASVNSGTSGTVPVLAGSNANNRVGGQRPGGQRRPITASWLSQAQCRWAAIDKAVDADYLMWEITTALNR
jgi:hypothetical protein